MKKDRPQFNLRVKPDEASLWEEAANLNGLTVSAWLRLVALRAARKEIKQAAAD